MATFTTRLGLRKPAPTDPVDVDTDIGDNMDILDQAVGLTPALGFPEDPYVGQTILRTDLGKAYVWNSSWIEYTDLIDIPSYMDPIEVFNGTTVTTTSTSFTATVSPAAPVETTFTAPASGGVYVTVTSNLENSASATVYCSWEMRLNNSAGAIVHAATENVKSVAVQDVFSSQSSTRALAGGLTPGQTYFVRLMHRVTAGTGTYTYRGLLIEPVIS